MCHWHSCQCSADFTRGAWFQARRAVHYFREGVLEAIEHKVNGGRADLLLRGNKLAENKAWLVWDTLGRGIRDDRIDKLNEQVRRYLNDPAGYHLTVEFAGQIPRQVLRELRILQRQFPERLNFTAFAGRAS